jgi:hypothetical protein
MSNLMTAAEAMQVREELLAHLRELLVGDGRISHDTSELITDIADDLLMEGWVTKQPE